MESPLSILKKYWKYQDFKKPQEKIITTVLQNKNTVVLLPTGGGKSICYQIPALLKEGVCLVISPLIALMNDQVDSLKKKGIKAIALTSSLHQEEVIQAFDNLQFGNYKFLYISPEKLQSEFIQQKIKQLNINLIAVDEAHCISEWGHDFRPAYLKIPIIKELGISAPILALTATATKRVLSDIITNLEISDAQIFKQSLKRSKLALKITQHEDVYYHLKRQLPTHLQPVIIYASSRKRVKDLSLYLNKNNFKSSYYHGGLSVEEKQASFNNWMKEKTPIMVATNAFGMGIDKDNVQQIIHIDLPNSLENYMQEAGRAGRNGQNAISTIFGNEHTIFNLKNQFKKGFVTVAFAKSIYNHLNQYLYIAYGELPQHSFEFNLTTFCNQYQINILQTYNTLKLLEREQILSFDENFNVQSSLKFKVSPNKVLDYAERNNNQLIKVILRTHGGIFDHYIKINESIIAKKTNTTSSRIKSQLIKLEKDGLVKYNYNKNTSQLKFLVPREDDKTILKIAQDIKQQNSIKLEKMNAVIHYVKNNKICRSKLLLDYFDEKTGSDCGICDVCLSTKKSLFDHKPLARKILELLSHQKQLSAKEIITSLGIETSIVLTTIQNLLNTDKISINSQNKLEMNKDD